MPIMPPPSPGLHLSVQEPASQYCSAPQSASSTHSGGASQASSTQTISPGQSSSMVHSGPVVVLVLVLVSLSVAVTGPVEPVVGSTVVSVSPVVGELVTPLLPELESESVPVPVLVGSVDATVAVPLLELGSVVSLVSLTVPVAESLSDPDAVSSLEQPAIRPRDRAGANTQRSVDSRHVIAPSWVRPAGQESSFDPPHKVPSRSLEPAPSRLQAQTAARADTTPKAASDVG